MPVLNTEALAANRIEAIRAYHIKAGTNRAELDVSGGIDSALMLVLLSEALGPERVTAVYSSINSSDASLRRARLVSEAANVPLIELDLTATFEALVQEALKEVENAGYEMGEIRSRMSNEGVVLGSLRSCLRAPVGRFLNRMTGGGIRHGTGNEDEDRWLRFYQKGGDGEVDTNPLAMLSKGEVYQLANALHVPREIIEALPTPDLWGTGEKHNDEEELTRLSGGVEWTYSRINPDNGEYARVGTIERLSRMLDIEMDGRSFATYLFGGPDDDLEKAARFAVEAARFGLTPDHLKSARKWERLTRHKMNPNCPSLGTRQELLDAGLITNLLPEV